MKITIDGKELNVKLIYNGNMKLHKVSNVYFNNGSYVLFCTNLLTGKKESCSLLEEDLMSGDITPAVLQPGVILSTETNGHCYIRYAIYNHPSKPSKNFDLMTAFPSAMPAAYTQLEGIHTSKALDLENSFIPLADVLKQTAKIDQAAKILFKAIDTDLYNIKTGHLNPNHIPSAWLKKYLSENFKRKDNDLPPDEAKEISVLKMLGAYFCANKGIPEKEQKVLDEMRRYFNNSTLDYDTYYTSHPAFREAMKTMAQNLKTHIQTNSTYMGRDKTVLMTFITRRQKPLMLPNMAPEYTLFSNQLER